MANPFTEGMATATEVSEKRNPFSAISKRIDEAIARRAKTRDAEDADIRDLKKSMFVLRYKHDYDKELEKIKGEEEIKKQEAGITQTQKLIESFRGGGQNLPPGTTAKVGNLTIPVNREFTEGESKTLSQAGSVIKQAEELKSILQGEMESNKSGKKTGNVKFEALFPFQVGSKEAQNYKLVLDDMSDRILRLRSGAQINEREYQRLRKLLPRFGRYHEVDIKQLDKFLEEFTAIEGRIEGGATWDKKQNKFIGGQEQQAQGGRTVTLPSGKTITIGQ